MFLMVLCQSSSLWGREPIAKKDVIRFATCNSNYRAAFEKIAANYEKLHPNIDVKLDIVPLTGFETWIRSRYAAGGELVPDIYNSAFTNGYDRQGKWLKLNPYMDSVNPYTGKKWRESFDIKIVDRYMYSGGYYQIPIDYVDVAIFYNKAIFNKLGLTEPKTWEELLSQCQEIKKADYVPISAAGDINSFWMIGIGWLMRLFGDAYLRDYVVDTMSRPGDWDYDPARNANFHYDPNNLYADMMVTINDERLLNAIRDGVIDFRSERIKQMYRRLKTLSQYFQKGYMGSELGGAIQLFYQQKAAMCFLSSARLRKSTSIFRGWSRAGDLNMAFFGFLRLPTRQINLFAALSEGLAAEGWLWRFPKKMTLNTKKMSLIFLCL